MNKKFFITIIFIGFSFLAKSQVAVHKLLSVGYVYQNQSFLDVGGKLLFTNNDNIHYRLGASAMLGGTQGKAVVLPRLQGDIMFNFQDNVDIYHSYYFIVGAETTTKYFAPKVGFNILGMIDLTGGYGFNYGEETIKGKTLKGFNFNFGINVPLVMLRDLL